QALLLSADNKKGADVEAKFGEIGWAASEFVVPPPSNESIYIEENEDASKGFRRTLVCMGRAATRCATSAAPNITKKPIFVTIQREVGHNDWIKEKKGFVENLPASLKGWKPVRMSKEKAQLGKSHEFDEPGPSSLKRIKVEE
ncbi:hypothetical protein PFISCL1PPCAC_21536, partial [Pristionchus fissidentatus]